MPDFARSCLSGVLSRLKSFTDLTDIVGNKIYTDVPQQTGFPYCVIEMESSPFQTKDNSVDTHSLMVHGFSDKNSPDEALQIRSQVFNALDRQESNITLSEGGLVYIETAQIKDIFKEPDGVIWHSLINFNILIT